MARTRFEVLSTSATAAVLDLGCNGFDDDCSADTPDEGDGDADGFSACVDCDDAIPEPPPKRQSR